MPLATEKPLITLPAGADLLQGQHVKISGSSVVAAGANATDVGIGILTEDVANGTLAAIAPLGSGAIVYAQANAAIAIGARLAPATGGTVATAASGNSCIGVALEAATAAGHLIKVVLAPNFVTV